MKEKTATSLVVALGIALAASVGFIVHARSVQRDLEEQLKRAQACVVPIAVEAPEPIPVVEPVPVVTNAAPAINDVEQQRRILELEASLRAKDDVIFALRQSATNTPPSPDSFWRGRQEWLDKLKTENPEQYAEIMRERDESRQRVREAYARKADHFLKNDTSVMTEAEQQDYNLMLKLLDDAWKISDQLRVENLPSDQRHELVGAMHETADQLVPLLETERNKEFYNLGLELGYKEDEAAVFVTYVTNILDATSIRSVMPRGRGGPWWGRDGSTNR